MPRNSSRDKMDEFERYFTKEYWDQFDGEEPPVMDEFLTAIADLVRASFSIYSDGMCGIESGMADNLQHHVEKVLPMLPEEVRHQIRDASRELNE